MSSLFAKHPKEEVCSGSQTELEYLVVSEIISYSNRTNMETDLGTITIIYSAVLEFASAMDVLVPLGPKDEQGIRVHMNTTEHFYEAFCITQLKITNL